MSACGTERRSFGLSFMPGIGGAADLTFCCDASVRSPGRLKLTINLKTANALGLNVPLHIQQLADEVIE